MIPVRSESMVQIIGDYLMTPLMYVLQGTLREVPQRTHRWNNTKYTYEIVRKLKSDMLVAVTEDPTARPRWFLGFIPLFHMPIFGGWKMYVVLGPEVPQDTWYVGWVVGDAMGVSNIVLRGPVRLLKGSGQAQFFGLNEHGEQIALKIIGEGNVGQNIEFAKIPLL